MKWRKKYAIKAFIFLCLVTPIVFRLSYIWSRQEKVMAAFSAFLHERATITGVIDEEPVVQGAAQNFTVRVESVSLAQADASSTLRMGTRVRVSAKSYPRYSYGEEVSLVGKLALPRNFGDSGSGTHQGNGTEDDGGAVGGGREFDYVHYLSKDGIFYVIKNPDIVVRATGRGNPLVAGLLDVKQAFLKNIYAVLGEPHAALAAGLVVGEKTGLGKELLDEFRRSGLIHIVILSGYSVNIIANSIRGMLAFLPRAASLSTGAVAIILFGILVGAKATVVRACAMAIIAISAQFFYRDYNALRALLLTAYVMILQNPLIVPYDASFQVSFTATLGLILIGKYLDRWLHFVPERFGIRGMVVSTLATQIAVFPLLLYMMGDASVIGVAANLLVLPFIPVMMFAVFCTGALGFVSVYLSSIAGGFSYALLGYTLFIVHFSSHIPYTLITVRAFPLWVMGCAYAGYAGVYFFILKRLPSRLENSSRSPPS